MIRFPPAWQHYTAFYSTASRRGIDSASSKVVTRPGPSQSPAYAFLGRSGKLPGWNFSKYVVDREGRVVAFFPSEVPPESPELRAAIDKALSATPR